MDRNKDTLGDCSALNNEKRKFFELEMNKEERHNTIRQLISQNKNQQLLGTKKLADHFGVSEMTIRRDLKELEEVGLLRRYHGGAVVADNTEPSAIPGKSYEIGIIVLAERGKYANPFTNDVLEGIDIAVQSAGSRTVFTRSLIGVHTAAQAQALLQAYPIDGLILIGSQRRESVQFLMDNIPHIVSGCSVLDRAHDAILIDSFNGIKDMVQHLASLGHRRIAFITGNRDDRQKGYLAGLREFNPEQDDDLCIVTDFGLEAWNPKHGSQCAGELMNLDNPPDAIICASDRLAMGAIHWLHKNNYRVPHDIAVTGFDNIAESEYTSPPLTTVHVHKRKMGELIGRRLIRRMDDPEEIALKVYTPTSLIIRESCGYHLRE